MKVYNAVFNENVEGVYAISLVDNPAMESYFIALSEQKKNLKLKVIDQDKRMLLGAVLIPEKLVFRKQGGNSFYIKFDKDTIRKVSENFQKNGFQNNSTHEHNENLKLSDVTFIETWIKEDEKHDKSALYGLNEPVGTWFATMKVNNDKVWYDVKRGVYSGFSIDGLFEIKEVNNKSNIKMSLFKRTPFGGKKNTVKLKLSELKLENDSIIEVEVLEVGQPVYFVPDEGDKFLVSAGEYTLEDGTVIIVDENGIIVEIKEASVSNDTQAIANEVTASLSKQFSKEITALKTEFSKQLNDLKKDNLNASTRRSSTNLSAEPKNRSERLMQAINRNKR